MCGLITSLEVFEPNFCTHFSFLLLIYMPLASHSWCNRSDNIKQNLNTVIVARNEDKFRQLCFYSNEFWNPGSLLLFTVMLSLLDATNVSHKTDSLEQNPYSELTVGRMVHLASFH
jgi:hypothetical protein